MCTGNKSILDTNIQTPVCSKNTEYLVENTKSEPRQVASYLLLGVVRSPHLYSVYSVSVLVYENYQLAA